VHRGTPGDALHETAPLRDSKIVGDKHSPCDPFRERHFNGRIPVTRFLCNAERSMSGRGAAILCGLTIDEATEALGSQIAKLHEDAGFGGLKNLLQP
jgi:hypothetical protein